MSCQFKKFVELYEFDHQTSSPKNSHSYGKVENAKYLMTEAVEIVSGPFLVLLNGQYRLCSRQKTGKETGYILVTLQSKCQTCPIPLLLVVQHLAWCYSA